MCIAALARGPACTNETYRCDATSRTCVLRAPSTEDEDCQSDASKDAKVCASCWPGIAPKQLCDVT